MSSLTRNQRLQIATKIEEEPFETTDSPPKRPLQKLNNDLQFAAKVTTLPEMPESVKNIAKQFLQSHSKLEAMSNMRGGTLQLSNSNSSRNLDTLNGGNRSFSQKSFQLKTISDGFPKMSARLNQLSSISTQQQQFQNSTIASKDLSKTPIASSTQYKAQGGFKNIKISKQISHNPSQADLMDRNSHIPDIYKEYLPHIIKKQMAADDAQLNYKPSQVSTSTNFQKQKVPHKFPGRKHSMQQSSLETPSQIRQDVSYLKEGAINPINANQPTILTTGDRQKDEFIGVALGMKNIGQSLIDLPQSLLQLQDMLQIFGKEFQDLKNQEAEEKIYERYLQEHFNPTDLFKDRANGMSLNEFTGGATQSQFTSKFLKNQKSSPNRMFNVNEKNVEELLKNEKMAKVNTKPDMLALISNKIFKKHGKAAFSL